MRMGVIDVGSNTVHMLVVDAVRGGHPLPAHSHKIELRLAENVESDGSVTRAGETRLCDFIAECAQIAENQGIEETFAFATSAMRDAPNSAEVVERIAAATGVRLHLLDGPDEARLTFLAVRRWFGWSSGKIADFDIGGGSFEIAVGLDEEPDVAVSLPLGAGRLTRDFVHDDPIAPDDLAQLRRHVRVSMARQLRPLVREFPVDRVVGTSKTFRSLSRITGAAPRAAGPFVQRRMSRADLSNLVERLAGMDAKARAGLPGVSPGRAPQLLAGAVAAHAAMELLGVERLDICPWALREGVILRQLDNIADD